MKLIPRLFFAPCQYFIKGIFHLKKLLLTFCQISAGGRQLGLKLKDRLRFFDCLRKEVESMQALKDNYNGFYQELYELERRFEGYFHGGAFYIDGRRIPETVLPHPCLFKS